MGDMTCIAKDSLQACAVLVSDNFTALSGNGQYMAMVLCAPKPNVSPIFFYYALIENDWVLQHQETLIVNAPRVHLVNIDIDYSGHRVSIYLSNSRNDDVYIFTYRHH